MDVSRCAWTVEALRVLVPAMAGLRRVDVGGTAVEGQVLRLLMGKVGVGGGMRELGLEGVEAVREEAVWVDLLYFVLGRGGGGQQESAGEGGGRKVSVRGCRMDAGRRGLVAALHQRGALSRTHLLC